MRVETSELEWEFEELRKLCYYYCYICSKKDLTI
jgi:hypothetical protein